MKESRERLQVTRFCFGCKAIRMDRVDSILESQVGRGIHIFTCKRMAFSHGSSQLTVLPIQSHQCHSRAKKEILEISQARWGSRMGLQVTSREQTAFCWSSVRHSFGPLNGRLLNLKGDTLKLACLISMCVAVWPLLSLGSFRNKRSLPVRLRRGSSRSVKQLRFVERSFSSALSGKNFRFG